MVSRVKLYDEGRLLWQAQYNFQWEVEDAESGNSYNQQEARDGDHTQGRYEVLLPDGTRQVVVYRWVPNMLTASPCNCRYGYGFRVYCYEKQRNFFLKTHNNAIVLSV